MTEKHKNRRRKLFHWTVVVPLLSLVYSGWARHRLDGARTFLDGSSMRTNREKDQPLHRDEYDHYDSTTRPRGVFVFKVPSTEKLEKTLCTLKHFFNGKAQYPIRIFTDHLSESDETILNFTGIADVQIIHSERWKQLPTSLTVEQRSNVIQRCRDFDDPEKARCTNLKVSLGYIFNTYWTYMEMADEPALAEFDYFVLFDNDAFLTKPMPDPFEIMDQNNLVGIYNIESMEGGLEGGIQQAVETSFTVEERRNAYLNSPSYPMFDEHGVWGGEDHRKPGVWMCMFGGRLDFLRSERFKEFAQKIPFHTYTTRTSRQSVIPIGWSVLVGGDRVWYLPKRGVEMGVYHHGWVDDAEIIVDKPRDKRYRKHTLEHWQNFTESKIGALATWKEYMFLTEASLSGGEGWRQCIPAIGSKYGS